jgi:hypothetical protein
VPDEVNQIESVCETIQKSIHQKVQDNLSQVEADCQKVLKATAALLQKDELEKAAKRSREIVAIFFAVCAWTIPTIVFLTLVVRNLIIKTTSVIMGLIACCLIRESLSICYQEQSMRQTT